MSRSQKVEGLLFDLGGVLLNIDFNLAFQTWKKWTLLPVEELQSRFKMDEAYEKHERGEIEASQYFDHLRGVLELEATDSDIALGWNAIFVDEIEETLNYISKVRRELPCFAFTNSNRAHQSYWYNKYPRVVNSFDKIFVSSDLGFRKPERRSFEAISNATGISLGAMLFFDDMEENVSGARESGMRAVCVKNHTDVKHALVEIGVI
ncbi:HAD-IA family hydrolase [Saccharospirillum sp.]|uniref:HAD-IA family hydrolase n=1 Tax=Saccharospirillum sp. TaxID=2033801 RepID=UPI0034A08292